MRLAMIGGTGVYDPRILEDITEQRIETPYGAALVRTGTYKGEEVAFLARHGAGHTVPPHLINYRANIYALKKLGVERVIATAAVGTMNQGMPPGSFVFIDQFLDFTHARPKTFFEGGEMGVVHQDVTEPYCPQIRGILQASAEALGIPHVNGGTYACYEGPRFETPAEIRAATILGADVVGMTNVPEVVLAREAGLCYTTICMCTNWAAGIATEPLTHEEVLEVMAANVEKLRDLAMDALERIPVQRACRCARVPGKLM